MQHMEPNRERILCPFWLNFMLAMLDEFWLQKSALDVKPSSSTPTSTNAFFVPFQGQYFSGGNFRIYLLGNPIVWWSNLVFLAMFLLTYFMAAIKQQRGYDADEKVEVKSE